ncbi:heavy metal translocating P-type ATPase [Oceanicoccus sp. KOV_DT_Chl]|uniref:heavy metal translocating P-type ATPase n=1 Tax=Oceanicoccus sp. KOV_DT_Chl TaxID=1904639 RepID=UPI001F1BCD0B|nr:heavy metal translocating P-type ATPase [Oceanicoccus sp. KOV_DT_Chl]
MVQAKPLDCYHCGLGVVAGADYCADLAGESRHFCCPACREVAQLIAANGLTSFYQYRTPALEAPGQQLLDECFVAFDDADFQQRYVTGDDELASIELLVGGIHCAACVWLLEQYLSKLAGVVQVSVSLSEQKALLKWHPQTLSLSAVCQAIAKLGYQPEPYNPDNLQLMQQRENHQALRRLGVAGIGMMQVGMFAIALYAGAIQSMEPEYRSLMRWVSLLVATPIVFYSAQPFFIGAWRGVKMRAPGMDLPVAIAIGLAYLASVKATVLGIGEVYFDSVAMFTFLLLGGRYLEMRARHFSSRLSADLNSVLPAFVECQRGESEWQSIPLFKVKVADRLLIKPGQVIPADGVVVSGTSKVDESAMTGEFTLQRKAPDDEVIAASVNSNGSFIMAVTATGAELKLQMINQLLHKARLQKPKQAQWVDRLASRFVLAILTIATLTFAYWYFIAIEQQHNAFWIMLSVLVVSCPCALSLATPAAITAATNSLRAQGLLVTNADVWELMPTISDVVCDKTGTLTKGELSIAEIYPVTDISSDQALAIAAALEHYSEHPIATAFARRCSNQARLFAEDVELHHGLGITGSIEGERYCLGSDAFANGFHASSSVAKPGKDGQWLLLSGSRGPLCWFKVQDTLRDDAAKFIQQLKQQGLTVHLLSGDSSTAVEQLSNQLGMDHFLAAASPEQKLHYITNLQQRGASVLMLGDGINDVPVLAAADISVAMTNASNLAKTQADSILLSGQLSQVLLLIALSMRTSSTIKQNILWALGYNVLTIPLAVMGLIAPYLAALGMSLSSLMVIANALRLQKYRQVENNG